MNVKKQIIVSTLNITATSEAVGVARTTTQAISYIPYGEVFVEQQAGGWSSPYLFNAKELDSETGLYYYGARYLDPSDAMWLSVDPLWEKYVGMTPYNYCGGNPVVMVDPDGRSMSAENEESQQYMQADFEKAFGSENAKHIIFDKNRKISIDNEKKFLKGLSKSQKSLYKNGLKSLIEDNENHYMVLYSDIATLEGKKHNIVTEYGGGAYSVLDKKIVVSPSVGTINTDGAKSVMENYSDDGKFTFLGYTEDFSNVSKKYTVEQNTTSCLFHEIAEATWCKNSSEVYLRGMIIDYENIIRRILNMHDRPYDSYHYYDKNPNYSLK